MARPKSPADILVIKPAFRTGRDEALVKRCGHAFVTINRAVHKFDLQNVKPFAITDRRQARRIDRLPRNARANEFGMTFFGCAEITRKKGKAQKGEESDALHALLF